jgi:hypothetical protein
MSQPTQDFSEAEFQVGFDEVQKTPTLLKLCSTSKKISKRNPVKTVFRSHEFQVYVPIATPIKDEKPPEDLGNQEKLDDIDVANQESSRDKALTNQESSHDKPQLLSALVNQENSQLQADSCTASTGVAIVRWKVTFEHPEHAQVFGLLRNLGFEDALASLYTASTRAYLVSDS